MTRGVIVQKAIALGFLGTFSRDSVRSLTVLQHFAAFHVKILKMNNVIPCQNML